MADAGGGLFYEVNRLEDLAGAYERVVTDLEPFIASLTSPRTRQGTEDGEPSAFASVARMPLLEANVGTMQIELRSRRNRSQHPSRFVAICAIVLV